MSSGRTVSGWLSAKRYQFLQWRFKANPNLKTLQNLVAFCVVHGQPFPADEGEIRAALVGLENWRLPLSSHSHLVESFRQYLLYAPERALPGEWQAWLRECRAAGRPLPLSEGRMVRAIWSAWQNERLDVLPGQERDYLAEQYWRAFPEASRRLQPATAEAALPTLLEYAVTFRPPMTEAEEVWLRERRHGLLLEQFVDRPTEEVLLSLLEAARAHELPFPIEKDDFRQAVFRLPFHELVEPYRSMLLASIQGVLFVKTAATTAGEWQQWLRAMRITEKPLDVLDPVTVNAIRAAYNNRLLQGVAEAETHYLLACFKRQYQSLLAGLAADQASLPVLLELAAITQVIGPDDGYLQVVEQWSQQRSERPRALSTMAEGQALAAPAQGIGSPHGMAVTYWRENGVQAVRRIAFAGSSGDATLNAHVFANLFALGLSCEVEPSFITANGGVLSVGQPVPYAPEEPERRFLSAVIGPGGPVAPRPDTPVLGMSFGESMVLVEKSLESQEKNTGLIRRLDRPAQDAAGLEAHLRAALLAGEGEAEVLVSAVEGEGQAVSAIPLLYRHEGDVRPFAVEIPYHVLGSDRIFRLLRGARSGYLEQVIQAGRRREAYARRIFQAHNHRVELWKNLAPKDKEKAIAEQPSFRITQRVDFELGISVKLAQPYDMPRVQYEETVRPQLRDDAAAVAAALNALCDKLEKLNAPGGRADILTFKLVFDAMLRRAPLAIADERFQEAYEEWVGIASEPVWSAIATGAKERGISAAQLAGDEVVFNARIDGHRQAIVVEPWLLVDVNNHAIRVDHERGRMELLPGRRARALADMLAPAREEGIVSLEALHEAFYRWAGESQGLQQEPEEQIEAFKSGILEDKALFPYVQLNNARRLLSSGFTERAAVALDAVRGYDLAPIYFWGMLAHQCKVVERIGGSAFADVEEDELPVAIINVALTTVFRHLERSTQTSGGWPPTYGGSGNALLNLMPVSEEAESYLGQLQAKAPELIEAMLQEPKKTLALVDAYDELQFESRRKVGAAIAALASLELLNLAERMENTARALPFAGIPAAILQEEIDAIIERARALQFYEGDMASYLAELKRLYGQEPARAGQGAALPEGATAAAEEEPATARATAAHLEIYGRLQTALYDNFTVLFEKPELLRALFVDERIVAWRPNLPRAISAAAQVEGLVAYLRHQYDGETNRNGLLLFLQVLSDDLKAGDARQEVVAGLIEDLAPILAEPSLAAAEVRVALVTSRRLVSAATARRWQEETALQQRYDAWGMAAVKRQLHVFSDFVAQAALQQAGSAQVYYPYDVLTKVVPLIVRLRWERGYRAALEQLLDTAQPPRRLRDFEPVLLAAATLSDGVLSAERREDGAIVVRLDGQDVALLPAPPAAEAPLILSTINKHGRLGLAAGEGLLERLGALPLAADGAGQDPLAAAFRQNLAVLIPLVARLGMPGSAWLLPDEENYPQIGVSLRLEGATPARAARAAIA